MKKQHFFLGLFLALSLPCFAQSLEYSIQELHIKWLLTQIEKLKSLYDKQSQELATLRLNSESQTSELEILKSQSEADLAGLLASLNKSQAELSKLKAELEKSRESLKQCEKALSDYRNQSETEKLLIGAGCLVSGALIGVLITIIKM